MKYTGERQMLRSCIRPATADPSCWT